jgi:tetratricopeptide (TPR) repeat protein
MIRISLKSVCFFIVLFIACSAYGKEDLEALIKKGNEAFEKAEYEKAMKIYDKGLKAAPKESVLFYNKANVLQHLGKREEALETYKEAIKNNPKKVLLKNIYFNEGNALYTLAKDKSSKEGAGIEELKEALAGYEKAFDKYRKSLDLERKISIANGTDIHKAGIYAKQNWALARDAWTKTWERIREIEKKNLKLEDGIQNLLQAQNDLLPRLESFYLYSFSEDSLKFNLKTLSQYQIDSQEDILHLQEIAQKDVDRVFAELENYKAAQDKDDKKAAMGGNEDPELAKLNKAHEDALSVQRAVDTAAGLEGWIIDGLKRADPVGAWENSRSLISLLYYIVDYLKKSDHVKNIYTLAIKELHGADRLLSWIDQISLSDDKGKDIKSKTVILGAAKLDAGAQDFLRINKDLEALQGELEKQVDSPLPYAHANK